MHLDSNVRIQRGRFETEPSTAWSSRPADQCTRRAALTMLAASAVAGCGEKSTSRPEIADAKPRTDVPLRILLAGDASDAEAIRVGWSMTMEQPLTIDLLGVSQATADADTVGADPGRSASLTEQIRLADVAILPQHVIGEVSQDDAAVAFSPKVLQEYEQVHGKPFPAVANGLGSYGGETWGVAVGAKLLALLAADSDVQCDTWGEYHDWVADLDGKAAEPLADGWAATSFLNRCATSVNLGWLFNRTTMKPEVDGKPFVRVLEQMSRTAKLYRSPPKTPTEIWRAIRIGELRGGIGYEAPGDHQSELPAETSEERVEYDVSVFDGPVETETDRLWFGRRTPLAFISSGCRQTDASKRFIGWLTGGERMISVRQQTEQFSQTRAKSDVDMSTSTSGYSRWLAQRLQTRQVVPALILPGADDYQRSLDDHVTRCLAGALSPAEALANVANDWESITERLGRPRQIVAWKRTLGFGG